jgi:hypothetical protein
LTGEKGSHEKQAKTVIAGIQIAAGRAFLFDLATSLEAQSRQPGPVCVLSSEGIPKPASFHGSRIIRSAKGKNAERPYRP